MKRRRWGENEGTGGWGREMFDSQKKIMKSVNPLFTFLLRSGVWILTNCNGSRELRLPGRMTEETQWVVMTPPGSSKSLASPCICSACSCMCFYEWNKKEMGLNERRGTRVSHSGSNGKERQERTQIYIYVSAYCSFDPQLIHSLHPHSTWKW